jgi:hypothetical protein
MFGKLNCLLGGRTLLSFMVMGLSEWLAWTAYQPPSAEQSCNTALAQIQANFSRNTDICISVPQKGVSQFDER